MTKNILALNTGSSSIKFSLYEMSRKHEKLLYKGIIERIGLKSGNLKIVDSDNKIIKEMSKPFKTHQTAFNIFFNELNKLNFNQPSAIGHRIVHGGEKYTKPVIITNQVFKDLKKYTPLAPLHMPASILGIEEIKKIYSDIPQVACFDTSFFNKLPEIARTLPVSNFKEIKKYGFHGLSYEYILSAVKNKIKAKTIIAHIGNGISLTAVKNGRPIDTSMSFTPSSGCMMGTRSGDIDPGILIYLARDKKMSIKRIEHLINSESGLLGISEKTSDLKILINDKNEKSKLSVDILCYQIKKQIGSLVSVLNGLDQLIFTGGIGENSSEVRFNVCKGLKYLGLEIDNINNKKNNFQISSAKSRQLVQVIPTHEDIIIARHALKLTD